MIDIGKTLISLGLMLVVIGCVIHFGGKVIPFGKLPGDINIYKFRVVACTGCNLHSTQCTGLPKIKNLLNF